MKHLLLSGLLFSFSLVSFGQKNVVNDKDELAQARIKKQIIVADLENQIKNIPFAAVRVYSRYGLASWIWKDETADSGTAEEIVRAALDDHYKNKDEIPIQFFYNSQLFVLLDAHAKDVAKQLREKYNVPVDEVAQITSLLNQKDGDKLAVDAAVRLLSQQNDKSPDLLYLLMTLDQKGSPELNRLLGAFLLADETGHLSFTTNMIETLTGFYIKPSVPNGMEKQFIGLVLARSRNVAALSVLDQWAYYRTVQRLWPDISVKFPEMLAEAGSIKVLLSAQVDRSTREANERNERLQNSEDKLSATVAEAEHSDNNIVKYGLYRSAARLALEKKKFTYAADLMEKASEIDITGSGIKAELSKKLHDEFYRDVVIKALGADEIDAANHSVKKMNSPFSKAESLETIAKYFIDKHDMELGRSTHDEALKLVNKGENSPEKIATLIKMLQVANKLGTIYIGELSQILGKSINGLPSLNADDKPDSKNYREYVTKVMIINSNLRNALTDLVKINRNATADIAGLIDKKEIKIIADYVLLIDSIDTLQKQKNVGSPVMTLQ